MPIFLPFLCPPDVSFWHFLKLPSPYTQSAKRKQEGK